MNVLGEPFSGDSILAAANKQSDTAKVWPGKNSKTDEKELMQRERFTGHVGDNRAVTPFKVVILFLDWVGQP